MHAYMNGYSISYTSRNDPSGTSVIFIHGFPLNKKMWEMQMDALPEYVFGISYDVRGSGESEVKDGMYTLEFFVDDLIGLMDHLKIEKAILCGISMGGYIALRLTERNPERVRALVLCDTKSEADPDHSKLMRSASINFIKEKGMPAYGEEFVKSLFRPESLQEETEAVQVAKTIISGNTALGMCGTLLALAGRTDTTASLSRINLPTLLIAGEDDRISPPSQMEAMKNQIPGSHLEIIPKAAHLSNMENPSAFNQTLLRFLDTLAAA